MNGSTEWHQHGKEEEGLSKDGLSADNILLFGRVTYEMMAGFWPTPMASEQMPEVAAGMNNADKIVFSSTLKQTDWQNTSIMNGDIVQDIRKLKKTNGKDMTILGSGTIVTQFAQAGLIDDYQIMIDPVALGKGTSIFNGMVQPLHFKLTEAKTFKSGTVLLNYKPA
jgi:dihydrofolate reductase